MKALVVYGSVYGNTEQIARAIGEGLGPTDEVKVIRASEVDPSEMASVDVLIIGSPTQAGKAIEPVQKFVDSIPTGALDNVTVATFDTRVDKFIAKIFGYAGDRIAKALKDKGAKPVVPPEGFIVKDKEGPLKEGELERATAWARSIAG